MESIDALTASRRVSIRRYFRYVDDRDPRLFDLFTDDVELYFPKFGFGKGIDAMRTFGGRMAAMVEQLEHDIDGLAFFDCDSTIIVEGTERGVLISGKQFPDGGVSQGRFCNVFRFRGEKIASVHIYTDPDFGSEDAQRVRFLQGHPADE